MNYIENIVYFVGSYILVLNCEFGWIGGVWLICDLENLLIII